MAHGPERLRVEVLSVRPHDPRAFTQGLVLRGARLFESTGRYGDSSLREVDAASGEVIHCRELPQEFWGEGLAAVGEQLVQLTYCEETALVYDLDDLRLVGSHTYQGEGWGLCYDGRHLVMSDGSSRLSVRDAHTFAIQGQIEVLLAGRPVSRLNALECAAGAIYANVWQRDQILRIEPNTGEVTAVVDASPLVRAVAVADHEGVLNGIAYDSVRETFLLTGKLWPSMFEVVFVHDGAIQ